jgi:acyl carrier protein
MTNIEVEVMEVVKDVVDPTRRDELSVTSELLESKLIDSFGLIQLVSDLEVALKISIMTEDMTIQNFSSIPDIAALVARIRSAQA